MVKTSFQCGQVQPDRLQRSPNSSSAANTHIIVVIFYGLSCEVEYSPRYDTLTDEMANFKICSEDSLRLFILKTNRTKTLFSLSVKFTLLLIPVKTIQSFNVKNRHPLFDRYNSCNCRSITNPSYKPARSCTDQRNKTLGSLSILDSDSTLNKYLRTYHKAVQIFGVLITVFQMPDTL